MPAEYAPAAPRRATERSVFRPELAEAATDDHSVHRGSPQPAAGSWHSQSNYRGPAVGRTAATSVLGFG